MKGIVIPLERRRYTLAGLFQQLGVGFVKKKSYSANREEGNHWKRVVSYLSLSGSLGM